MTLRIPTRLLRHGFLLAACVATAGCGTVDGFSRRVASAVTPYKIEVVQGNFISREQVDLLKPGISRQQVREILGTPLVTSLFHGDRWDYVFTLKRDGVQEQPRRLTVFFKGEALDRVQGDAMPSEAEFVAAIGAKPRDARQPVLEASPEQLERAASAAGRQNGASASTGAGAPAAATPPAPASYPPLESPSR